MYRSRVRDEVLSCPRVASEELRRQEISLEAVAGAAREDHVAWNVCAAVRERMDMIERGEIEFQVRAAVHAAAAAVAHGRMLDRAFLVPRKEPFVAVADAGGSGERDSVEMPTSGQFHLAKMGRPAEGRNSQERGVAPTIDVKAELLRRHGRCAACIIAALDIDLDVGRVGSLASGGTR